MQLRTEAQGKWEAHQLIQTNCRDILTPPAVGSLLSLVGIMPLNWIHLIIRAIMYTPGIIQMWRNLGDICPMNSLGHTVIATCAQVMFLILFLSFAGLNFIQVLFLSLFLTFC